MPDKSYISIIKKVTRGIKIASMQLKVIRNILKGLFNSSISQPASLLFKGIEHF